MLNNPILVLGSKPESILPKIRFQKIYAANGAAERSNFYKKTNTNLKLTCVAGAKSIDNLDEVRSRIIDSKPDKLVVRFNKSKYSKELQDQCIIETINYADQWNFQKEFFYNPNFSLLIGEFSYKENLKKKIKKLIKFFFKKNLQGVSTGFFTILLALVISSSLAKPVEIINEILLLQTSFNNLKLFKSIDAILIKSHFNFSASLY